MFDRLLNRKKYWFTLIELLLVCSVFAILVSGVIMAINRSYSFMDNIRIRIRATNFAREWVEMLYNMRDTNRRKFSWERDKYWLYVWSGNVESSWVSWVYILKNWSNGSGDEFFYVENLGVPAGEINDFYSDNWFWKREYSGYLSNAEIQFDWDYQYMEYLDDERVQQTWSIQELLSSNVKFYRIVRVFGIYCKNSNNVNDVSCSNISDPKEMRFCVKVFYKTEKSQGSPELCSVMTNFTK